jgi:hypothetical protein
MPRLATTSRILPFRVGRSPRRTFRQRPRASPNRHLRRLLNLILILTNITPCLFTRHRLRLIARVETRLLSIHPAQTMRRPLATAQLLLPHMHMRMRMRLDSFSQRLA